MALRRWVSKTSLSDICEGMVFMDESGFLGYVAPLNPTVNCSDASCAPREQAAFAQVFLYEGPEGACRTESNENATGPWGWP